MLRKSGDLYLYIEKLILRHVKKNEVVDFDLFLSDSQPKTVSVVVYYNSNNNYNCLSIVGSFEDHVVLVSFQKNGSFHEKN